MKVDERISVFNQIRDLPFVLTGSRSMYCYKKCLLLQAALSDIGLKSKIMAGFFNWSSLPIPSELISMTEKDRERHTFLRVYIPETDQWVDLDPSWDNALHGLFPIAHWDGVSSTDLIANLIDIGVYKKRSLPIRILLKIRNMIKEEVNSSFYRSLDKWLDQHRKTTMNNI